MRWAFDDFERIKNRRKWLFDKWNEHLSAGRAQLFHIMTFMRRIWAKTLVLIVRYS